MAERWSLHFGNLTIAKGEATSVADVLRAVPRVDDSSLDCPIEWDEAIEGYGIQSKMHPSLCIAYINRKIEGDFVVSVYNHATHSHVSKSEAKSLDLAKAEASRVLNEQVFGVKEAANV